MRIMVILKKNPQSICTLMAKYYDLPGTMTIENAVSRIAQYTKELHEEYVQEYIQKHNRLPGKIYKSWKPEESS